MQHCALACPYESSEKISVADPIQFDADPDLDPAPRQNDANLQIFSH
jgi:hypothetical protein